MKSKLNYWIGALLIGVAVFFIARIFGAVPEHIFRVVASWPSLITLIGVIALIRRWWEPASILLLVGAYFLIPHICLIYGLSMPLDNRQWIHLSVALLLVMIGLKIIFFQHYFEYIKRRYSMFQIKKEQNGSKHINCAFGEINHTFIEKPFQGATVSTAFGGVVLNMSKTTLPEGDSFLDINTAFGGIVIIVPTSWNVESAMHAIFGGVDDKRIRHTVEGTSRLYIRGAVVFGGVEIRSTDVEEYVEYDNETNEESIESIETISVKHNNKVHIITLDELKYIQADGDYVTLCTDKGKFLKEQTMKYYQNALPSDRFMRIHRSTIVNLNKIASIDCRGKEVYYVILKDGSSLRSSAAGYQMLKQQLEI